MSVLPFPCTRKAQNGTPGKGTCARRRSSQRFLVGEVDVEIGQAGAG